MPGTWSNNTCGYCGYTSGSALNKYVCPKCKRTGCTECMPSGDERQCNQCDEKDERDLSLGMAQ